MPDITDQGGPFATFKKLLAPFGRRNGDPDAAAGGLDFLPGGYTERRRRRRSDAVMLALLVMVVGVVAATWNFSERALAAAEAEFREVDARYTEAARRIEQVKQMRLKQKTVADRMELTASLLEKMPRSNLLAELTNALPHGVSLTDCELVANRNIPVVAASAKGTKPDPAEAAMPVPLSYDTQLSIEGLAHTEGQVSDYIDVLGRSGYFESVDLRWVRKAGARGSDDADMRMFMIALTLDPNATAKRSPQRLPEPQVAPSIASLDGAEVEGTEQE